MNSSILTHSMKHQLSIFVHRTKSGLRESRKKSNVHNLMSWHQNIKGSVLIVKKILARGSNILSKLFVIIKILTIRVFSRQIEELCHQIVASKKL